MKKLNPLLLLTTIVFIAALNLCIYAQDNNTSIFWKVTGNGIEKTSYLYGTVHLIPQSDFFLIDSIESKFKSCDEIVLEVDMDDPEFLTKTQQLMFMPDNKSIQDLLDSADYGQLSDFFKDSLNLTLNQFQRLKPFFLVQFILPKMINKPLASYELTFVQMAKKYNIDLTGLESVEEQMNSIDKIPFKKQAELVLETIKDFNEDRLLYSQLIDAYKKMDFKNFYNLMVKASPELKEFEQILLIDRNEKWVPRIEKMIKEKSCFIAVGALHLEGENGLVALLKSDGYSVTPIK
ncbi:MAG: TraB/GumN family protein [Ignavibacteriaceae bacterium]